MQAGVADEKPDTLAILKQYPNLVEMVQTTDLNAHSSILRVTLCRSKHEHCESFEEEAAWSGLLTDYVYLCAVYDNDCRHGKHAKSKGTNASALIQEANDKGYGQTLLGFYEAKYDCGQAKDVTTCVLHKLFVASGVRRSIAERRGHTITYVDAGEDGEGDPFGE
jgi:hypothetical protein